jgi:hypothetical protein
MKVLFYNTSNDIFWYEEGTMGLFLLFEILASHLQKDYTLEPFPAERLLFCPLEFMRHRT